jgi:hypothetical protein
VQTETHAERARENKQRLKQIPLDTYQERRLFSTAVRVERSEARERERESEVEEGGVRRGGGGGNRSGSWQVGPPFIGRVQLKHSFVQLIWWWIVFGG